MERQYLTEMDRGYAKIIINGETVNLKLQL